MDFLSKSPNSHNALYLRALRVANDIFRNVGVASPTQRVLDGIGKQELDQVKTWPKSGLPWPRSDLRTAFRSRFRKVLMTCMPMSMVPCAHSVNGARRRCLVLLETMDNCNQRGLASQRHDQIRQALTVPVPHRPLLRLDILGDSSDVSCFCKLSDKSRDAMRALCS